MKYVVYYSIGVIVVTISFILFFSIKEHQKKETLPTQQEQKESGIHFNIDLKKSDKAK